MKTTFLSVLTAVLLIAGCSSSKKVEATKPGAAPAPPASKTQVSRQMQTSGREATVYVEGKRKAVTPATVKIMRSMGESSITIQVQNKEVRRFELERARTASGTQLDMGFGNDDDLTPGGGRRYDVSQLSVNKKKTYLIPYHPGQLTIEDREYDLTLVIVN